MKFYSFSVIIIAGFLLPSVTTFTQGGFKGTIVAGINASQIDEDDWAGYDKFGLSVGGRLSYTNSGIFDLAIEMLYSQRGAAQKRFANEPENNISLNYFEIPVLFSLRDWSMDNGKYYRVRAEAGLSYGFLFGAESTRYDPELFRKHDLSWVLGGAYQFSSRIGLSLRFTSSMRRLFPDPVSERNILKSYFFTLRSEFYF